MSQGPKLGTLNAITLMEESFYISTISHPIRLFLNPPNAWNCQNKPNKNMK